MILNPSPATSERPRRTQAERRAAGRNALIESAIACLGEKGFGATTIHDIVRRANCTTGAIQHHFGSKNGLYIAVLDDLMEEFKRAFEKFPAPSVPLEKRLDKAVEILLSLYTSDRYSATFSLVLGAQHDPELRDLVATQRRGSLELTRKAWRDTFSDTGLSDTELRTMLELIAAVLRDFHFARTVGEEEARRQLSRNLKTTKLFVLTVMRNGGLRADKGNG
jgi:AcrR family transcriptional regulator